MLLRLLLRFVLRKLVSWLPESTAEPGSPHSETLPTELHRVFSRQLERVELALQADAYSRENPSGDSENPDTENPPVWRLVLRGWGAALAPLFSGQWWKTHFLAVIVIVVLPLAGLISWSIADNTPRKNVINEDVYRQVYGTPLVRIAYVSDWPCSVATAYLNAELLRARLHADILFKPVTQDALAEAWTLLTNDKVDVFVSAWLPMQQAYLREAADKVQTLGKLHSGARMGLAVPAWMPQTSIADLASPGGEWEKRIYGIDPGARLNRMVSRALEDYNIPNVTLVEKSERHMENALREAMRLAKPVVVAAWSPHTLLGEFSLRFLDDPRGVFGGANDIHLAVSRKFAHDFELICAFLGKERLEGNLFSDLIYNVSNSRNIAETVKKWLEKHRNLVEQWQTEETAAP